MITSWSCSAEEEAVDATDVTVGAGEEQPWPSSDFEGVVGVTDTTGGGDVTTAVTVWEAATNKSIFVTLEKQNNCI